MSAPRASIMICTRNREELLARCLDAMLADRSEASREFVIVDNGSTDETQEVVRSFAARCPHPVAHLVELRVGTTHARNAAVSAARGELLLFADDDIIVSDGWADALVAGFDDPGVAAVAGRILPEWPFPPPAWLTGPHAEILTSIDNGPEPRILGPDEKAPMNNLALRGSPARAFQFEPRLGHAGRVRLSNEDTYFVHRLRALGAVAYRPDAVVCHVIEPERIDLSWMRTAYFHHGIALARIRRLDGDSLPSLPRRLVGLARALRCAARARRKALRRPRVGPETCEELFGLVWVGHEIEQLLGRSRRLSDWLVRHA